MSAQTAEPPPGFVLARDPSKIRLSGTLTLEEAEALWLAVRAETALVTEGTLDLDLAGVALVDGGAMALLVHARAELRRRGVESELVGASPSVQQIVTLYAGDVDAPPRKKRRHEGTLAQIGRATFETVKEAQLVLGFLGEMVLAAMGVARQPRTANWREILPIMEKAGVDAVPIVVLINFLIGFVMAFQGAVQLRQFGANIYVADLVGLSIVRELGPLMTAIILCGRSGAAFAAELGTMKVSEEIDALRTLGFGPMRFLVLPRAIALVLVMPFLTLFGDAVGVFGGLVVGLVSLDLTVTGYLIETKKALSLWDVSSGLLKSVVFGLAIALIACQQGFATTGGAEGVGRRTTSSVVTILFTLILIDAGFTLFFHAVRL